MKHTKVTIFIVVSCMSAVAAQSQTSPKDIFERNKGTVVQIFVNDVFSGCGFIVSRDGFIATANHVVATPDSGYQEYYAKIEVRVAGDSHLHTARKISPITTESRSHDSALLKIERGELPFVTLGDWGEVEEGEQASLIVSWPKIADALLLSAQVAGKNTVQTIGPISTRAIFFQAPVRKGFSGSPIFSNSTGHVIGIVTTRVFGIQPVLDQVRKAFLKTKGHSSMAFMGIDFADTNIALVDGLDLDLVTGLGSAVDAVYVDQIHKQTKDSLNYKNP